MADLRRFLDGASVPQRRASPGDSDRIGALSARGSTAPSTRGGLGGSRGPVAGLRSALIGPCTINGDVEASHSPIALESLTKSLLKSSETGSGPSQTDQMLLVISGLVTTGLD